MEQQRLEQARFTAAQQRPGQPVDPAEFVRNLDPTLRRQVLADMDDTVLAVLPPELSTEAQGLRRELEQRRVNQMERAMTRSDFSQFLRHTGISRGGGGSGFQSIARLFPRGQMNSWKVTDGPSGSAGQKKLGRQLLDPESLTCLLVLLFMNESTLNSSRLHRILRNLSYHNPTKQWIILALISILRRTSSFHQESNSIAALNKQYSTPTSSTRSSSSKRPLKSAQQHDLGTCVELPPGSAEQTPVHEHWLSRTLNLAFGGCVNIFQMQKVGRKSSDYFVTVNQQACLDVCKQTLEALSFLAKNFPSSFSPQVEKSKENEDEEMNGENKLTPYSQHDSLTEFWDVLVRLNSATTGNSKGKAPSKMLRDFPKSGTTTSFVTSPLGQILSMLSHPVIKQSTLLTDKLLRLLAVISISLPERPKQLQARQVDNLHGDDTETAIRPPDNPVLPPDNPVLPSHHHSVTFADTDDVLSNRDDPSPFGGAGDEYAGQSATEAACSETASVTSSLYVEPPENAEGTLSLSLSLLFNSNLGHSDLFDDSMFIFNWESLIFLISL